MEKRNYIWINGEFVNNTQPVLSVSNRSFAYGDGFFETIHAYGTEAKHLHLHVNRMLKSMQVLGLEVPAYFNHDFLSKEITRLLNKNRDFGSVRVRVTVYRNEGGLYTPTNNTFGMTIQSTPLLQNFYPINSKGLVVDIFTHLRKPINMLSPIKSCNAQLYVLAGIFKNEAGVDDCIIINDQNRIAEAISSNIFIVKDKTIYTPSISEGCVAGIMRQVIITLAKKEGFKVIDDCEVKSEMLANADELFLTNAISGIQWIVGLRHKRYFGVVSRKLSLALNKETFPDQFKEGFSG
jgi:branched-subunit amino acid aminotransferase/4-amino-4-deoxychorismate lyase